MDKKADISMNMIIVAALAMLVLIVVVMLFSGKMRIFGNTMQSCEAQGGECSGTTVVISCDPENGIYKNCKIACSQTNPNNYVILQGTDCEADNKKEICCKQILG